MAMLFISHSSQDQLQALDVRRRLLERGYRPAQIFLDSDAGSGIPPGSPWEEALYARLRECRALLVLCSASWQRSRWCFAELVFARAMGKEVFPVLLEPCDPGLAGEHQAVAVYGEGEAAWARLWAALESRHLAPRDDHAFHPRDRALAAELLAAFGSAIATATAWESGYLGVPHLLAALADIPDGLLARFLARHSVTPQRWKESLRSSIRQLPPEARFARGLEPTAGVAEVFATAQRFAIPVQPELTERAVLRSIFLVRADYLSHLSRRLGVPLSGLEHELAPKATPLRDP
ncbi:MAG TPA: TIR domain-containing protein [Longimicrobium sp.]|nr:TIR domain-containing protein [Longimicrobium sp.]